MKRWRAVLCLLVSYVLMPTACKSDGLIGGDCAKGYEFCHGSCISITDDEANCGGCDIACRRRLACVDALCGGPDGDITVDDETGGAGGVGPGGADGSGGIINVGAGGPGGSGGRGGGDRTGGTDGGGNGGNGGNGQCLAPPDSPNSCGACGNVCPSSTPNCTPTAGGGYECQAKCTHEPFITQCSGKCVDLQTDPGHCGRCGNACASGICIDGECVGAASGHQIAICASYERTTSGQTTLLANSVFLSARTPVRILAFVRNTSSASLAGTDAALESAATLKGRGYNITKVTALNSVNNLLNRSDFDVLLVYDQQNAPSGQLAELGTSWASTVEGFSRTGGVIVVLTGGAGSGEMTDFIENIGLFSVDGTDNHNGERFYVQAPGDAVGINVVSPFLAAQNSCLFETTAQASSDLVFVVSGTEPPTDPAVVHRIVPP